MSTKQTEESKQQKKVTQVPAKVKAGPIAKVAECGTTSADDTMIKLKVAPIRNINVKNIRSSTFNATQSTKEENLKKRKRVDFESTATATDEVVDKNQKTG